MNNPSYRSVWRFVAIILSLYAILMVVMFCEVLHAQDVPASPFPICTPKVTYPLQVKYGPLAAGLSDRANYWATWVCEAPTGYTAYTWLFSFNLTGAQQAMDYIAGKLGYADLKSQYSSTTWATLTASESTFIHGQNVLYVPRALVAYNAGAATRNVYGANSDGTLNPKVITTIAVGTKCNVGLRLVGTPYYSVTGQTDPQGNGLGDLYTVCTVVFPLAPN